MPRLPLHGGLLRLQTSRACWAPVPRIAALSYTPHTFFSTRSPLFQDSHDRVWPYLYSPFKPMAPQLDSYFKQVDSLQDKFIDRLREAVAIPSISSEDERRPDVVRVGSDHGELLD
jgi:hypothetical protein